MTTERKEELRQLCEAANDAPWTFIALWPNDHPLATDLIDAHGKPLLDHLGLFWQCDAAFIVTARIALPELLDALADAERANICDACAGEALADCMCGGTGLMTDAVRYLRERLLATEQAARLAREALDDLQGYACDLLDERADKHDHDEVMGRTNAALAALRKALPE